MHARAMKPKAGSGVSIAMKALLALALVTAIVLVWYLRRADDEHASAAPATATATSAAPTAAPTAPKRRPTERVRKLTAAERATVAQQIRDARAGRAATSAPAAPSLRTPVPSLPAQQPALDPGDIDSFKTTMRGAMKEVIPYLAECFDTHAARLPDEITVRAELTLTGDPDIGTLIDTRGLARPDGAVLDTSFDTCLRDALAGLELPPLAEGEEAKVTYPFMFTR